MHKQNPYNVSGTCGDASRRMEEKKRARWDQRGRVYIGEVRTRSDERPDKIVGMPDE